MVEAPGGGPAGHVALGTVRERRLEARRRLVALDLPEHLVEVAAGAAVAVRGSVSDGVLEPPLAGSGRLQARDGLLELLLPVCAPPDVPEPRRVRLGELERVVEELAPPTQEHRPARAPRLLETEHLRVETQGLVGRRGQNLDVGELGQQTLGHGDLRRPRDPNPPPIVNQYSCSVCIPSARKGVKQRPEAARWRHEVATKGA